MQKSFLYILTFRDEPIIKIGITTNPELLRLKNLQAIYPINFDISFIIESKCSKTIEKLERELLFEYQSFQVDEAYRKKYEQADGKTELRHKDCLDYILKDLAYKAEKPWIDIEIKKGIKLSDYAIMKEISKVRRPKKLLVDGISNLDTLYEIIESIRHDDRIVTVGVDMDYGKGYHMMFVLESSCPQFTENLFGKFSIKTFNGRGYHIAQGTRDNRRYVDCFLSKSMEHYFSPIAHTQYLKLISDITEVLLSNPKLVVIENID
jgi:hypothetical protein